MRHTYKQTTETKPWESHYKQTILETDKYHRLPPSDEVTMIIKPGLSALVTGGASGIGNILLFPYYHIAFNRGYLFDFGNTMDQLYICPPLSPPLIYAVLDNLNYI